MKTTSYIRSELERLENSANTALNRIRKSRDLAEVIREMALPIPPGLRSLRHTSPAVRRVRIEAQRRAESLVRNQIALLAEIRDEAEFLRTRGALTKEWHRLNGHFPSLASLVKVESDRLLNQIRLPYQNTRRDASHSF